MIYLKIPIVRVGMAMGYSALGGLTILLLIGIVYLDSRPDLELWHSVQLTREFTLDSDVHSFEQYLALEDELFAELDNKIYQQHTRTRPGSIDRYQRGSLSDPGIWKNNWNRSFEMRADPAAAGALLLHGMSDSPYSLRQIAQRLNQEGIWVLGLRLPGHGTIPSALTKATHQDMSAAVRLAMRHLQNRLAGKPIYLLGYSTGAALALEYVIASCDSAQLPPVNGVVMISPAIGVSAIAALAVWQARIGHLLGLKKLEWNSLLPEYDPFKYGSFAVNAGDQVYRLTRLIDNGLRKLEASGKLNRIPPILAFQSIVDATVSTPALIDRLFRKLPPGQHELVLFDINHDNETSDLLVVDPDAIIAPLLTDDKLGFALTLVSNRQAEHRQIQLIRKQPQGESIEILPTRMQWPTNVYSLSHVALPFPAWDPLYGNAYHDTESRRIHLGAISLKGEKNTLNIPAADLQRQRWNPFYPYLEKRLLQFIRP